MQAEENALEFSAIDVTLPGTHRELGSIHPLTQLLDKAVWIFRRLGFALADGPDIETEWHCFDALNTPPDHPARNEFDTFYLPDGRLLRTHTSTVQFASWNRKLRPCASLLPVPPIGVTRSMPLISRNSRKWKDSSLIAMFQLADLKGTLEFFFRELFGPETKVRFRPHFFPFTEPSYEIDIRD